MIIFRVSNPWRQCSSRPWQDHEETTLPVTKFFFCPMLFPSLITPVISPSAPRMFSFPFFSFLKPFYMLVYLLCDVYEYKSIYLNTYMCVYMYLYMLSCYTYINTHISIYVWCGCMYVNTHISLLIQLQSLLIEVLGCFRDLTKGTRWLGDVW